MSSSERVPVHLSDNQKLVDASGNSFRHVHRIFLFTFSKYNNKEIIHDIFKYVKK